MIVNLFDLTFIITAFKHRSAPSNLRQETKSTQGASCFTKSGDVLKKLLLLRLAIQKSKRFAKMQCLLLAIAFRLALCSRSKAEVDLGFHQILLSKTPQFAVDLHIRYADLRGGTGSLNRYLRQAYG